MRPLIEEGNVYAAMSPLYKVTKGKQALDCCTDEERTALMKDIGSKGVDIERYKGLGEMDAEQLWDTTMNPEKRMLVKVTIDDLADAEEMITTLMGDNVEARKKYITSNANFNKVDAFETRSMK
jgi:DNA gyrase subunit B